MNPYTYKSTRDTLESYKNLEEDWDGYDGIEIDHGVIGTIVGLLNIFEDVGAPAPKSMVSGDGEVGLYWNYEDLYVEAGCDKEGCITYLITRTFAEENDLNRTQYTGEDDVEIKEGEIPSFVYTIRNVVRKYEDGIGTIHEIDHLIDDNIVKRIIFIVATLLLVVLLLNLLLNIVYA